MQVAAAAEGWQCAVPTELEGATTPGVPGTSALPITTEHGWQLENPVAPATVTVVGDDAHPAGQ
jgi:hypothetical protein